MTADLDHAVRVAAFDFLRRQTALLGARTLPRSLLAAGFQFRGHRVPLLGPQGIFKPAICRLPISMTTVPNRPGKQRPYEDEYGYDGIRYRYRGEDRRHPDNVGLRQAMAGQVPLVYFHGHRPGWYHCEWPVYVVADDPASLTFTIVADDAGIAGGAPAVHDAPRRAYLARMMVQRLHQSRFRVQVLDAYSETCAVCRLRHYELLDAAHILPDSHPRGDPVVSNGLALCKLHHAAFDVDILGIRPDLVIEVRRDVLDEIDGPMLRHGLQGFDQKQIIVPHRVADRPDPDFLAERYERFRRAG